MWLVCTSSIHDRHHDVAHDEVGDLLLRRVESLLSVGCRHDVVAVGEGAADVFTDVRIVFHHEHDGAVVVRRFRLFTGSSFRGYGVRP